MYKNFTLASLLSFVCFIAGAQFQKGQRVLGGGVSFGSSKIENVSGIITYHNSFFSATPSYGWFINPQQVFGVSLSYSSNFQKQQYLSSDQLQKTNIHNIGAGVFTQRFIGLAKNFYFTVNVSAGANITVGNQLTNYNSGIVGKSNLKGFGVSAGLAPGISYRLSSRWLFDASLNNLLLAAYTRTVNTLEGPDAGPHGIEQSLVLSSSLSGGGLSNIGIGFRWLLKN